MSFCVTWMFCPVTLPQRERRRRVSRAASGLRFESTINLAKLGVVVHFGKPLDRNLSPCPTVYTLKGVVFHRGTSARSGHYFAYIRFNDRWVRLDDDKVVRGGAGTGADGRVAYPVAVYQPTH